MKNPYLLLLLFLQPLFTLAQKGYYSVGLNSSYHVAAFSTTRAIGIDEGRKVISGIDGEKYFKFGLKMSVGIGLGYYRYKMPIAPIDNDPSQGFYGQKNQSYSLYIPLTIGYNLLPKKINFQLFAFTGYNFSAYFYSKTKVYNSFANPQEQTYINKTTTPYGQILVGLDGRYIIKNKFYTGIAISLSDIHYSGYYRVLRLIYFSAGIKAGLLF